MESRRLVAVRKADRTTMVILKRKEKSTIAKLTYQYSTLPVEEMLSHFTAELQVLKQSENHSCKSSITSVMELELINSLSPNNDHCLWKDCLIIDDLNDHE
ncbi:MAG: hypothetical protein AB1489_33890 [Acidobacteriota bacterium]